jgi:uncharacterized protein (DUF2141 family)
MPDLTVQKGQFNASMTASSKGFPIHDIRQILNQATIIFLEL